MEAVRDAWRAAQRKLTDSAVVVATLTFAIGALQIVFWITNGLVYKPLPVKAADRLAVLGSTDDSHLRATYAFWDEFQRQGVLPQSVA
jgi:hypothetical protein